MFGERPVRHQSGQEGLEQAVLIAEVKSLLKNTTLHHGDLIPGTSVQEERNRVRWELTEV